MDLGRLNRDSEQRRGLSGVIAAAVVGVSFLVESVAGLLNENGRAAVLSAGFGLVCLGASWVAHRQNQRPSPHRSERG